MYAITKEVVLPISTSAYGNGDVVGGLINLTDICKGKGTGTIRQIRLIDDDDEGVAMYLYLFNGAPVSVADNAAFATTFVIGDHKKFIGRVSIAAADYIQINSNKTAIKDDINLTYATGQLYAYLVTNGSTPTFTAVTDLTLYVTAWVDE